MPTRIKTGGWQPERPTNTQWLAGWYYLNSRSEYICTTNEKEAKNKAKELGTNQVVLATLVNKTTKSTELTMFHYSKSPLGGRWVKVGLN